MRPQAHLRQGADFNVITGFNHQIASFRTRRHDRQADDTDRATFLAALAPGSVQIGFDGVIQGASGSLRYDDGGFNVRVYAEFRR